MAAWLPTTVTLLCLSLSGVDGEYRQAVIDGDLAAVEAAITSQPALLQKDGLNRAAQHGHLSVMQFLLERGADPNARFWLAGEAPLHVAKDPPSVKLLLSAGADPSIKSYDDETPVQRAAWRFAAGRDAAKWREITSLLLRAGAECDILSAIWLDDVNRVRELLAEDPNLAGGNEGAETPLAAAAIFRRTNVVRLLLEHGVNADTGRLDGFEGADPFRKDWPILVEVIEQPEVVQLLIRAGADVRSPVTWHGCLTTSTGVGSQATPLHYAAKAGSVKSAEQLLAAGVPIDAVDSGGWTPLHIAAAYGRPEAVQFLLANGADPAIEDAEGRTPLVLAESYGESLSRTFSQSSADQTDIRLFEARNLLRRLREPVEAVRAINGDQ